ncbi:MAG: replication-associated recombination protein A [Microgenomates group bacterium]
MEPLANRLRPTSLNHFIGQEHLVGHARNATHSVAGGKAGKGNSAGPLRVAIEQKHLFSFILWGPPGVGKTTLAQIYAKAIGANFFILSAVSAGKDDIRKILEETGELLGPRVLFLDEIHRFNKSQQDFLLPYVESGRLTLIGATTENPSFEVIPALLSRCRVFVLEDLNEKDLKIILKRTKIVMDKESIDWLISMSGGDARQMLAMVENTQSLYGKITIDNLTQTLQSKFLRYDRAGEEHYNTISAFIKSMRASQPDAALYYMSRMIASGEDPVFIARRMVVFASEDVGNAQPTALVVANAVFEAVTKIGLPECGINLAQGVIYLCRAPKDRSAYDGFMSAMKDAKDLGNLPIPLHLRNAPTKLMKNLGYGKGYEMYDSNDYLPAKLKGKKYLK